MAIGPPVLLATVIAAEAVAIVALGVSTLAIDRRRRRIEARRERLRADWADAVFAVAEGEATAVRVPVADRMEFARYVAGVALSVQGEARHRLQALARDSGVEARLLAGLAPRRRRAERVDAAGLLGVLGTAASRTALAGCLDDGDDAVAAAAAIALARVGDDADLRAVANRLGRFSGQDGAVVAATLADRGVQAVYALKAALRDPDRGAGWAVLALGAIGDPSTAGFLGGMLEGRSRHADPAVRAAACRALGRLDEPGAAVLLARSLNDVDTEVRRAAAVALRGVASADVFGALVRALRDPDWWVRYHAAQALLGASAGRAAAERALGRSLAQAGAAQVAAAQVAALPGPPASGPASGGPA